MPSQPFDLSMMDYETIRKKKRRKLLLLSIGPAILVFLIALWFLLPTPLTSKAIGNYKKNNHISARSWLTPLTWSSPDQFVIAFNSGTVDTQLGKYSRAEKELYRAVNLASPKRRCMAAQNLVAALRAHAASLKKGDKVANSLTTQAETVIAKNKPCFKGASASSGGGGASSSSSAQSQAPTDAQQQQLEQKEQKGQERQARFARDEKFNADDPNVKRW